jgi:hypothetical protein
MLVQTLQSRVDRWTAFLPAAGSEQRRYTLAKRLHSIDDETAWNDCHGHEAVKLLLAESKSTASG